MSENEPVLGDDLAAALGQMAADGRMPPFDAENGTAWQAETFRAWLHEPGNAHLLAEKIRELQRRQAQQAAARHHAGGN
jgi:hypothetical protein